MDDPIRLFRRLLRWARFTSTHDELRDEVAFHREMIERDLIDRGHSPEEARYEARRRMGNDTTMRENARAVWLAPRLEAVLQDLRFSIRSMRRTPALTAGIVITFALGIGVYSAAFSLIDRLMFRAPPFMADADMVHRVRLYRSVNNAAERESSFQGIRFFDFSTTATKFSHVTAGAGQTIALGSGLGTRRVNVGAVTPSFFNLFNARPAIGRWFVDEENRPPAGTPVAVLSYAIWMQEYGGEETVLGKRITVGGVDHTIVGVAPEGFVGIWPDQPPTVFIPLASFGAMRSPVRWYTSYGNSIGIQVLVRRKPGVSVEEADADLLLAYDRSWQKEVEQRVSEGGVRPTSVKLRAIASPLLAEHGARSPTGTTAIWLAGVSLIVLIIACANVANLLLARAHDRRREMAVRVALGVSQGRLFAQLLTESLALAASGGIAGLFVGQLVNTLVRSSLLPGAAPTSVLGDLRTIGVAATATLTVCVLSCLAPMLQAGRVDPAENLRSGRTQAAGRSAARSGLLVLQVTLSVALLVGSGLFVRSWDKAHSVRLGFDPDSVIDVGMAFGVRPDSATVAALRLRLVAVARALPMVTHASLRETTPFGGMSNYSIKVAGVDSATLAAPYYMNAVGDDYFATMGIRILRGRGIESGDIEGAAPVAIVSQAMAERLWPGKDAIGECFQASVRPVCRRVVGIAENIRTRGLAGEPETFYYLPTAQFNPHDGGLFVRVRGDARQQVEAVRRALQAEMPAASYVMAGVVKDGFLRSTRAWDAGARIFTALGVLSAILAAVGLYSLLANDVARRRRELGVRIALGAGAQGVARLVALQGLGLTAVGAALGCGIALASARWVGPLLFQQSPRDPVVYSAVVAVVLAVALAASFVPALRAASADPRVALQAE